MPRNVRNFWIDLDIDGRGSSLSGGPASKGGGFSGAIYIRDAGSVSPPIRLSGWEVDSAIYLDINIPDGLTVEVDPNNPRRVRVVSKR